MQPLSLNASAVALITTAQTSLHQKSSLDVVHSSQTDGENQVTFPMSMLPQHLHHDSPAASRRLGLYMLFHAQCTIHSDFAPRPVCRFVETKAAHVSFVRQMDIQKAWVS